MLPLVTGLPWHELGLPRDLRNTARETRARFEYQDSCVVLRCIPNLLPGSSLAAVVIEWTTDYVIVATDGRVELVSVKHREEDQPPWRVSDLVKENVFRDLHGVWKEIGEDGDYVFESNRGISPELRSLVEKAADPETGEAARLAKILSVTEDEAARFASRLVLPLEPTPDRRLIHEVATTRLAAVMLQLGLDPSLAQQCVAALEDRVAAVAVDRPLDPEQRVSALAGLMREVRERGEPGAADFTLTMSVLREVVAAAAVGRLGEARVRPPASDPLFSGREAELASIERLLAPGPDGLIAPVVLTGMPGVGKSALAEKFATTASKRARVIAADTRAGFLAGLHRLNPAPEPFSALSGGSLAATPTRLPEPSIPDDPELLLVIDGLTDSSVLAGLVPRATRTAILITTTSPHVDDGFKHLPVLGLSQADAETYLAKVLSASALDETALLVEAFGGNALGLVQGANYCLANSITPRQYVDRLRRDPAQLLDRGTAAGHPQTLTAAIRAGLDQACTDPAANALAGTLALFAAEPVPEQIFSNAPVLVERSNQKAPDGAGDAQEAATQLTALTDPLVLDSAVRSLARHGLVSREAGGLRMHQLVQEVTRTMIGEPSIPLRYEAAVGLLLAGMDGDRAALAPDALTPHVSVVVRLADQANADPFVTSYLATWLGDRHYVYGDLATADSYLQQANRMAVECSLPPVVLSGILREVVKVRRAAGDIDGALAAADAWANAAQAAGSDLDEFHARFARVATLAYAARFSQAADEQSALAARTGPSELTASDSIMALSVQAEIQRGLGATESSLVLINQAIQLAHDQTSGLPKADHMAALGSQASALERDLGQLQTAVERQREAVSATRELRLPMVLARQLQVLASRLLDNEDAEEAAAALNEASEIAEAQGQKAQVLADILQTAGRISLAAGDPSTAVRQLSEAIPLLEGKGEHYLSDLAVTWHNLATAQMSLSQYAIAASSYVKARKIETTLYGGNHPDLIQTEYHLAIALKMSGDRQAALDAINRCLRIIRRGGRQGRLWRNRALAVAIAIDLGEEQTTMGLSR